MVSPSRTADVRPRRSWSLRNRPVGLSDSTHPIAVRAPAQSKPCSVAVSMISPATWRHSPPSHTRGAPSRPTESCRAPCEWGSACKKFVTTRNSVGHRNPRIRCGQGPSRAFETNLSGILDPPETLCTDTQVLRRGGYRRLDSLTRCARISSTSGRFCAPRRWKDAPIDRLGDEAVADRSSRTRTGIPDGQRRGPRLEPGRIRREPPGMPVRLRDTLR